MRDTIVRVTSTTDHAGDCPVAKSKVCTCGAPTTTVKTERTIRVPTREEIEEAGRRPMNFADTELLYAASSRCRCGAGLAYPLDFASAQVQQAWLCSAVLKGATGTMEDASLRTFGRTGSAPAEHEAFPWAFYKIREETSVNNRNGTSTRPEGTHAYTVGHFSCPICHEYWKSEPYDAFASSHQHSGPCPSCGHRVGAFGTWSSNEGPHIQSRYLDHVVRVP